MNTTARFVEPLTRWESPQLQPLPDASEAGWDRWMIEVGGADFLSWRAASQPSAPAPSFDRQLRAGLADD